MDTPTDISNIPEFQSMLVHGPVPPHAAIHICLSHLAARPEGHAVLLTPSYLAIAEGLQSARNGWLNKRGGDGHVLDLLSRTNILCDACSYSSRSGAEHIARTAILQHHRT